MDSSSKKSKLRKGMRSLMDKLSVSQSESRSRSWSPSDASHPIDVQTLSARTEQTKGSRSLSGINLETRSTGALSANPQTTSPLSGVRNESGSTSMSVPTVVESTVENATIPRGEADRASRSSEMNVPEAQTSTLGSPEAGKRAKNAAWTALRTSLKLLHESSGTFAPLSSAVGILLSCLDGLEDVAKNQKDYEELATTLTTMSDSLKQHTSLIAQSGSASNLALSLERQAIEIKTKLEQRKASGLRGADASEEELLGHYRRAQSLFQQLQMDTSLSTWRTVNEHLANTRLEGLNPVKQATYDSNLSAEVSRRGCTDGTRTTVLQELHDWLNDSSSASIYWMNGMAGTGKTTIAYTFCEQVEQRKQLAASFFCTRNAVECKNTTRIVPTIAYQLARYSFPYQSELCKVLGQNPDLGSKHLPKQFEQLLRDPLQQVKATMPDSLVVVVDALDECQDRSGVELLLDLLFRHAPHIPLRFLITSRPEPGIFTKMRLHEPSRDVIHLHDIETSLVRADIELYLTEELAFMSASRSEVEQLSHRAGSLFIYAATLVRYILYGKRVANPRQRLQSVLSLASNSTKKHAEIDALYKAILESALRGAQMEDEEAEDVKVVLRTVLFAQEPIDVKTISVLGGLDDAERVMYALQPLRSVIHQSEDTGLVSTLHASFPDFLLSSKRSGEFYCDVVEQNQILAQRCFMAMKAELRFNICALGSSLIPDSEVEALPARIKSNISPTLAYICQYWASHLGMAKKSGLLLRMLDEFLSSRLLFWMEVLNLRRVVHSGIDMMQTANHWVNRIGTPRSEELLLKLVDDAYSFVTNFAGSAASQSTPHIYISCLPFCSRSSQVYKHYWNRMRGLLEIRGSLIGSRDSAALASWKYKGFQGTAFSSDSTRMIGGLDDAVMILNVYNGIPLSGPMVGHAGRICAVAFSSDDSRAVSASMDGVIRVWDGYSGTPLSGPFSYDTTHIKSLDFSDDGIVDVIPTPFNPLVNYIISIALSLDGTRIVACFWRTSTIYLWDATTGALLHVLDSHEGFVNRVVMSSDGSVFASASNDTTVRLWNVEDGTPATSPYTGHAPININYVTFTPDCTRLVSSSDIVHVWRRSNGSLVTTFAYNMQVCSLAVSPDGTQVASGSGDCTVRVWNIEDGTLLHGPFYAAGTTTWVFTRVSLLTYTPEGTRLVTRTTDGTTAVWPVNIDVLGRASNSSRYPVDKISSLVFSSDGTHILTFDYWKKLVISWDAHDGSFIDVSDEDHPSRSLKGRADYLPSPNGLYAVTVTGDLPANKQRQVINTSDNAIILGPWPLDKMSSSIAACFSQDSTVVAIGHTDGTIRVWDLQTREVVVGPLSGHTTKPSVALSHDKSLIASFGGLTFGDLALRVFNTQTRVLDIEAIASPDFDSASKPEGDQIYEEWHLQADGWVTNSNSDLLFWVPLEFHKAWPSPHTSLVVTGAGTVQVPKQTLLLGGAWHQCFTSGDD